MGNEIVQNPSESAFEKEVINEKTMTPLVSILIPCFNARTWLRQAIESSLSQTYAPVEVLMIDDGSSDDSDRIGEAFGDRITWIARENRGGNPTRNELLAMSSGQWIQYLDADDYLTPDKIDRQLESLKHAKDPDKVDVIYSPVRTDYYQGEECVAVHPPVAPVSEDPWILHSRWELTQTGGALFRKSALEDVGGWNEDQDCCQDNELFLRLLQAGKCFLPCPDAVAVYRRFEDGTVSTRKRARVVNEILRVLDLTEAHLRDTGKMTAERLNAINHHRFWLARNIWPWASGHSLEIMHQVKGLQPDFAPEPSRFAPASYRACYAVFGFAAAEGIAAAKRRILRRSS